MFEWSTAFETGIKEIDLQHQELFRIGAEINDLVEVHSSQDSFDTIMDCLEKLAQYTVYHFDTEEELFTRFGYPDQDEHVKEHQNFINYLNGLDLNHIDQHQEDTIRDLLKFVAVWIFKHINNSDFRYVDFLKPKMNQ